MNLFTVSTSFRPVYQNPTWLACVAGIRQTKLCLFRQLRIGRERYRSAHTAGLQQEVLIGKRVALAAQARGLIVRPLGNMAVMSPPLILTENQIEEIASILRDSIVETMQGLKKDGHL